MITRDPELAGLLLDRARTLEELAPVLSRVGPNVPPRERRAKNRRLRLERLALRKRLRSLETAIAARAAALYELDVVSTYTTGAVE